MEITENVLDLQLQMSNKIHEGQLPFLNMERSMEISRLQWELISLLIARKKYQFLVGKNLMLLINKTKLMLFKTYTFFGRKFKLLIKARFHKRDLPPISPIFP
ncbi:hypothetical protein PUN28_018770 [Cardiocondyla obscurior]|uniref:Uncharacterized protein n=1 Tax=Cardiocondyla obscurior TaxID=286306 RepID=A0AAW2EBS6_9HYME